jgi:hypothetical protein
MADLSKEYLKVAGVEDDCGRGCFETSIRVGVDCDHKGINFSPKLS